MGRNLGGDRGVVEDRGDAARDEAVDDGLRLGAGDGDDADVDGVRAQILFEARDVADLEVVDRRLCPRVHVVGGDDVEALRLEAAVGGDGAAQAARADQHHLPAAVEAEDEPQLLGEAVDGVAAALLAEAAEVGEVLADLRGCDAQRVAQLLRGDDADPACLQPAEEPEVDGEAVDDDFRDLKRHGGFPAITGREPSLRKRAQS